MNNICYICNINPGVECPGRKPNERTKCLSCLRKYLIVENIHNSIYQLECMIIIIKHKNDWEEQIREIIEFYKNKERNIPKSEFYKSLLEINNEE